MNTKSTQVLRLTLKECENKTFAGSTGNEIVYEIHLLNVGEHMERFGGHRNGLTVTNTASLIKRVRSKYHSIDVEYDIRDPNFWRWIESALSGEFGECHITKLERE